MFAGLIYAASPLAANTEETDFRNVPQSLAVPLTAWPHNFRSLPSLSFVTPYLRHDMHHHYGTIRSGDDWLRQHLGSYVSWADSHNSLLIVTWDDDDHSAQTSSRPSSSETMCITAPRANTSLCTACCSPWRSC